MRIIDESRAAKCRSRPRRFGYTAIERAFHSISSCFTREAACGAVPRPYRRARRGATHAGAGRGRRGGASRLHRRRLAGVMGRNIHVRLRQPTALRIAL
jgi:hypothetical protein